MGAGEGRFAQVGAIAGTGSWPRRPTSRGNLPDSPSRGAIAGTEIGRGNRMVRKPLPLCKPGFPCGTIISIDSTRRKPLGLRRVFSMRELRESRLRRIGKVRRRSKPMSTTGEPSIEAAERLQGRTEGGQRRKAAACSERAPTFRRSI